MSAPTTRPAGPVRFGSEALLPDDPRTHFSRAVNFAPGDGEVCSLNPPRFRWSYHPTEPGQGGDYLFTFQIAEDRGFEKKVFNVETEFNFYNTIAPLRGTGPFYWRIGYRDRTASGPPTHWSNVRSFTLAGDAEVWDRSSLARPDFSNRPHPRMLFSAKTLPKLQKLVETHDESRAIFQAMLAEADRVLQAKWWAHMPESDRDKADASYLTIAGDLALVAFCWRVTGDAKYAGVLERAVRFARYPKGGGASPEGAGGDSNEDSTQTTEFLALLYDWLYQDLSESQRRDFADSLDWRIDHFVNHFAWRRERDGKQQVWRYSLSTNGASHGVEGFYDTFPAAIAAYEESAHARECFDLGVHYMVGVGSSHGMESGSNEGPGYGNSKLAWMVNAASYLDSVFPEFGIGRNPWLRRAGAFYRAQTPVGIQHAPWGHGSNRSGYFEDGHAKSYRKLAFLTGDGRFLANYRHYGRVGGDMMRPWIECALPLWREAPAPIVEEPGVQLFDHAGWVMAHSGPPSDPDTYRRGVGMIFPCRPVGAYSHAFNCDNSFHIFGYGQDLSHAAGSSDYEPHAFHAMSHNTILVDGLGQAQSGGLQDIPYYSRIIAFAVPNERVAYWCGDATLAYPRRPFQPRHWWGRLSEVYQQRDLSYVRRVNRHVLFVRGKYFVILDDLAADKPARWSWLYHILPDGSLELDRTTGSFRYKVGAVGVHVAHLLGAGQLDVQDLRGAEGFRNPLTGEDYTDDFGRGRQERLFVAEHNLWLTTRDAHPTWRFLAVVYPLPPGGKAPAIEQLGELTVRVAAGDEVDVISFEPAAAQTATITVDLPAIAPAGLH